MRITIVTGFFLPVPPLKGGATERSWDGLAQRFAAAGHTVTFISRRWAGLPDVAFTAGVHHLRLPGFDHSRHLLVNLVLDFLWGLRVGRALPPADVTICNTIGLPAWLPEQRPEVGAVAVMIGRTPKGQVAAYGRVQRIYVPSSTLATDLHDRRVRVIGYPIDWSLLAQAARERRAPVTIGYIGRLHPEKGLDLLVAAAELLTARPDLPPWRLRIMGPADVAAGGGGKAWLEHLKQRAATLADRLEWLAPEFNPARLAGRYGELDIFCYPSLAEQGETFGVAVAEAMAAGCAAVVSSLDCFQDLVRPDETGLKFDHAGPAAAEQLADALTRLLGDPVARRRLAARGAEHVRRYDYASVAANILDDLAVLSGADGAKPLI